MLIKIAIKEALSDKRRLDLKNNNSNFGDEDRATGRQC
jgi:hypothetical protein